VRVRHLFAHAGSIRIVLSAKDALLWQPTDTQKEPPSPATSGSTGPTPRSMRRLADIAGLPGLSEKSPGTVPAWGSAQRSGCETGQGGKQAVLELRVVDLRVRPAEPLVEPVAVAAAHLGFVTGGQPFLRQVPEPEVVGCAGPAHSGGHPAGIDGVAVHIGPDASDGDGEGGDEQFAV
jgi:hypothetical protein